MISIPLAITGWRAENTQLVAVCLILGAGIISFSIASHDHIAFKAEPETYQELKRRLEAAGENYRESNHGYCKSIYVQSPDGLIVEFTQDLDDVAEIDALRRADAHSELAGWLAGDRRTNNELRGRHI